MEKISLKCGSDTESLIRYIAENLSDEQLDAIEIDKELGPVSGVAAEPITIGALITLTPIITIQIVRLIERWLENKRQDAHNKLMIGIAGKVSEDSMKALVELITSNNRVSLNNTLTKKTDTE